MSGLSIPLIKHLNDKAKELSAEVASKFKTSNLLSNIAIEEEWFKHLLQCVSSFSETETYNFKRHASNHRTNAAFQQLAKVIYAALSGKLDQKLSLTPEHKHAIKDALLIGLEHCTGGYIDRLQLIVSSLTRPSTFEDLLFKARMEIVDITARGLTDEVHAHNNVYKVAQNNLNFGVIYTDDQYVGQLVTSQITDVLKGSIKHHFEPFRLIDLMIDQIKTVLTENLYSGPQQDGYDVTIYVKHCELIAHFLGRSPENPMRVNELFITNEDYKAIDINWPFLRRCLYEKLIAGHYTSNFTDEELSTSECIFTHFRYITTMSTEEEIAHIFDPGNLWGSLNKTKQHALVGKLNSASLYRLISCTPDSEVATIFHHLSRNYSLITLNKAYGQKVTTAMLARITKITEQGDRHFILTEIFEGYSGYTSLTYFAASAPTCVPDLLNLINKIPLHKKTSILTYTDLCSQNALQAILKNCPEHTDEAITALRPLGKHALIEIFKQTNIKGESAIYMAAKDQKVSNKLICLLRRFNLDELCSITNDSLIDLLNTKNHMIIDLFLNRIDLAIDRGTNIAKIQQLFKQKSHGRNILHAAIIAKSKHIGTILHLLKRALPLWFSTFIIQKDNGGTNILNHANIYNPQALDVLIDEVKTLNQHDIADLLMNRSAISCDVISEALKKNHTHFNSLLNTLKLSAPEFYGEVFYLRRKDGNNLLMEAISNGERSFQLVYDHLHSLDRHSLFMVFQHRNHCGRSVLDLANPRQKSMLLHLISELDLDIILRIFGNALIHELKRVNDDVCSMIIKKMNWHMDELLNGGQVESGLLRMDLDGNNALTHAIRKPNKHSLSIIQLAKKLPKTSFQEALKNPLMKDNHVLENIIEQDWPIAEDILEAIQTLPTQEQARYFTNGRAFKLAARKKPELVEQMINIIQGLEEADQLSIFQHINNARFKNMLMYVAEYVPVHLPRLLAIIENFSPDEIHTQLTQKSWNAKTAYKITLDTDPQYAEAIKALFLRTAPIETFYKRLATKKNNALYNQIAFERREEVFNYYIQKNKPSSPFAELFRRKCALTHLSIAAALKKGNFNRHNEINTNSELSSVLSKVLDGDISAELNLKHNQQTGQFDQQRPAIECIF